jgi:hypothetical protein
MVPGFILKTTTVGKRMTLVCGDKAGAQRTGRGEIQAVLGTGAVEF